MADLSDVQTALAVFISQVVYPNGTGQPSIIGAACAAYPGWPSPNDLDVDMALLNAGDPTGRLHISIYSGHGERNTTRYLRKWQQVSVVAPTLTLTVVGQAITVGGQVPAPMTPHNLMVMVNRKPYVYAAQAADTPTSIATALATLIAIDVPGTTSSGPALTLPTSAVVGAARVSTTGLMGMELGRSERVFQITIWANQPGNRSALGRAIDQALRDITFLTMPDQTAAKVAYLRTDESDEASKQMVYRRDLMFNVEFAAFKTQAAYQIGQTEATVQAAVETDSGLVGVGAVITKFN